jgi:hypothetical protein
MTAPLALDLETPVREGFTTFATFVPKFLGFLVILLVGYVLAKFVSKLVDKVLERAGFDRAVERGGIKKALSKSQYDASDIVAKLVFFAIFLTAISLAVGALGIAALQEPIAQAVALIPQIIVAVILVVVGAVIAGAAKSFISNALGGLSYGSILGTAAAVLIMFGFVKAALDQVGIATQVTGAVLYAVLAAAAGVVIVGVGGGLIKPMQARWENALTRANDEKDKIKQQSSGDPYPAGSSYSTGTTTAMPVGADATTTAYRQP